MEKLHANLPDARAAQKTNSSEAARQQLTVPQAASNCVIASALSGKDEMTAAETLGSQAVS